MTGSKGLTHWTSETVSECSEIAGSSQGSPSQQPTMSVVKLTYRKHETGTEELCEIKWDYHIVRMMV
jgi:hypothetical protein